MDVHAGVQQAIAAMTANRVTGELHLFFKDGQLMQWKEIKVSRP